jgi:V/A-type H+-transporting ATPase subunit C
MSIGVLSRYAFINAKLRARIGSMLDERQVESLLQSQSLEELFHLCKDTAYEPLGELYDQSADIQRLEAWLFARNVRLHQDVAQLMDGIHAEIVEAMTRKLEVENLKGVLRLWFSNTYKQQNIDYRYGYLFQGRIVSSIDWERIVNAREFKQIIEALKRTPYAEAVEAFDGPKIGNEGMFALETALDRTWVRLLRTVVRRMHADERTLVEKVLDRDADLKNIINLVRFGYVYEVPSDTLRTLMLEGGSVTRSKEFEAYLASARENRSVHALVSRRFPDLARELQGLPKGTPEQQTLMVERYLFAVRKRSFHAMLRGYPFSFGIILSYFFLEERQDALIRTLINGINYRWSASAIREAAI